MRDSCRKLELWIDTSHTVLLHHLQELHDNLRAGPDQAISLSKTSSSIDSFNNLHLSLARFLGIVDGVKSLERFQHSIIIIHA